MRGVLGPGISWVDLLFRGRSDAIASAVLTGSGAVALIDPGPTSCLPALEQRLEQQGLRLADVTHLLLTHIHLDHAGAVGTIVRQYPGITVLVHERGATHLAHPEKLLDSATRLYGANMDALWGEFAAVPQKNLVTLKGGERIEVAGRTFDVAYTPGHASHHVSYFDASSGVAFVGDTAGVCINGGYVLPPTPPPDIDLELWSESVGRIESWAPQTLFLTHFGPVHSPRPHLQTLLQNLRTFAGFVRASLPEPGSVEPGTDDERASRFTDQVMHELRRQMTEAQLASYRLAAPPELLWLGLARYWRKKQR